MSPEAKAALLKRLADGRAKTKAAREDAKSKGLADPKPRKPRAKKMSEADKQALMNNAHESGVEENAKQKAMELSKKRADKNQNAQPVDSKEAIPDPLANKPAREEIRPIDAAKPQAVNTVAAVIPSPEENKSTEIDVPNLPSKKNLKKIVDDAEDLPEVSAPKDLSTTGRTKKADVNNMIVNEETGNQAITNMMPGQKESIKKMLNVNKTKNTPLTDKPEPNPREKTVESVPKHVPDLKAVEARAPFSFSAIRKVLYQ